MIGGPGPWSSGSAIAIEPSNPCRWLLADRLAYIISGIKLIWAKTAIHPNCSEWQLGI